MLLTVVIWYYSRSVDDCESNYERAKNGGELQKESNRKRPAIDKRVRGQLLIRDQPTVEAVSYPERANDRHPYAYKLTWRYSLILPSSFNKKSYSFDHTFSH